MARKKAEEESGGNWMDTYGDMVTLLLTFFIVLYSQSSINEDKWAELVKAFNRIDAEVVEQIVFTSEKNSDNDGLSNNTGTSPGLTPDDGNIGFNTNLDDLYQNIMAYVQESDMEENIQISHSSDPDKDQPGGESAEGSDQNIYLRFTNNVLFEADSAVLRSQSYDILEFLGGCLTEVQDDIALVIIKGHTAESPNSTVDSRELSVERAASISNYFEQNNGLPSTLMVPIGLANDYPIADNDTEEGRQKNRRVEIVIISKKSELGQNSELVQALAGATGDLSHGNVGDIVQE